MSTDYRIKIGFIRHHKTKKLKKRLGAEGVLALISLWEYAAEFRPDGELAGMSPDDIELVVDWVKDTPLVATLTDIGFLDGQEGDYRLHDWQEHNPWVSDTKERGDAARLSRLFRKNPDAAKELKAQGQTGITPDEYRQYERSTSVVRAHNDRCANAVRTAVAPAPTPVPTPAPAPKEVKAKSKAKERAPAPATPLPADFAITPELQTWADEKGYGDLNAHLDRFKDKAQAKGYQYTDWNAAFRNTVRDDWAGLRTSTPTAPTPRNGQRYAPAPAMAMTPEVAEFDAILRNLNAQNLQPVIEGECSHVTH